MTPEAVGSLESRWKIRQTLDSRGWEEGMGAFSTTETSDFMMGPTGQEAHTGLGLS